MDLPNALIRNSIERGAILHSTMFEDIDHGKFFVIIGISKNEIAGFFFINSKIHNSLYYKPEQFRMQYPLLKKDYSFLKYDSFLCATDIITYSKGELINSINKGTTTFVDRLNNKDIHCVLQLVRNSKLFSRKEKEQFFYDL